MNIVTVQTAGQEWTVIQNNKNRGGSAEPPLFLLYRVPFDPRLHGERLIVHQIHGLDLLAGPEDFLRVLNVGVDVSAAAELLEPGLSYCDAIDIHTILLYR